MVFEQVIGNWGRNESQKSQPSDAEGGQGPQHGSHISAFDEALQLADDSSSDYDDGQGCEHCIAICACAWGAIGKEQQNLNSFPTCWRYPGPNRLLTFGDDQ